MAPQQAVAGRYRHEAMLWRGDDEFLQGCVPFIREGIAAGQPVMVATTRPRAIRLTEALGHAADAVRFVDMGVLGANPACIIPAWADFVRDAAGRPCRGIGEPLWSGRSEPEVAECQLHESLLNVALPPSTPLWLRCPYEADQLPDSVIEEAERSHPEVVDCSHRPARTRAYAGAGHARAAFTAALPEPEDVEDAMAFGFGDLRDVRLRVADHAVARGVEADRAGDLALAAYELAANSVRHGGGHGELRVWQEPGALVLEISDSGQVDDLLVGRREISGAGASGRGLWMVHRLCDLVQLRSSDGGTTVRLHTWT